jgi:hypothetical protein
MKVEIRLKERENERNPVSNNRKEWTKIGPY